MAGRNFTSQNFEGLARFEIKIMVRFDDEMIGVAAPRHSHAVVDLRCLLRVLDAEFILVVVPIFHRGRFEVDYRAVAGEFLASVGVALLPKIVFVWVGPVSLAIEGAAVA